MITKNLSQLSKDVTKAILANFFGATNFGAKHLVMYFRDVFKNCHIKYNHNRK